MATWVIFDKFITNQLDADATNFAAAGGSTIKIALVTNATAPAEATHEFLSSFTEVSGTNYTAGGYTLANKTLSGPTAGVTTFGNTVNPSWAQNATGFSNAYYAVMYRDTGVAATSPVIMYADLSGPVGNVSGALTLSLTSSALFDAS